MTAVKAEDEEHVSDTASRGFKSDDVPKMNGFKPKKASTSASTTPDGSHPDSRASSASPDGVDPSSDSVSTPSNGSAPKPLRKASQKGLRPAPRLFDHLPDATAESCEAFQVINDCLYGSKHMGSSEHDALDCDCAEGWRDGKNYACGEDSDCINRATKMECVDDECNCGDGCQNQRFQQKQYAPVSVIRTDKKGYGLRADADLHPNDFIFEYIGEVINEATFRRRMIQYDDEGIKHFYFMSLTKSEFVDATKKGNLGRFCNHSCNPNCYVDKWVVGTKLRMGIFAGRSIKAGEELVFNYNVDRYGAEPQPCYCAEPNCTGFIGGKTQTERATKLPPAIIEALGIEDGDSWDTTVARRPRKKKAAEDDEDYINSLQPAGLREEGVTKVMAALMQCKEKWITVKLLGRIQEAEDDERVRHRVVRMHGYQILKTTLNTFVDDTNLVLQILDILYRLPRLTKNKISDSKIEDTIQGLAASAHVDVASESARLLAEWSKLETAYRIPRKKIDPSTPATHSFAAERRNADREEETTPKPDPFANMVIPKGPRSSVPQRNTSFFSGGAGNQRPRKPPTHSLPAGWFVATDKTGAYYYYDKSGTTTWKRPTAPAAAGVDVPKGPTKAQENQKALQDIIDSLTKDPTPRPSASQTPQPVRTPTPVQEPKKDKWRSLPVEKQMKIYENTLFPHVKYVMDKFRHKLPKEELKKFGRDVNKKLVASDYKNNRVDDPTSITAKQERKVKLYVKDFFDRAVQKYRDHEKKKAERAARHAAKSAKGDLPEASMLDGQTAEAASRDDDVVLSDVEGAVSSPSNSSERKRKREDDNEEGESWAGPQEQQQTPSEAPSAKRFKEDETDVVSPSPPPPPPPPPEDGAVDAPITEEERSMREQEEALMRENEEAQRLADEEEEKEEVDSRDQPQREQGGFNATPHQTGSPSLRPAEMAGRSQANDRYSAANHHNATTNNGLAADYAPANGSGQSASTGTEMGGVGEPGKADDAGDSGGIVVMDHESARKQGVLSH